MKLELISPKRKKIEGEREYWDYEFLSVLRGIKQYSVACLALPTLAALTPPDFEVKVTDENIEEINFDKDVGLVGITANTFLVSRAYEIADEFRKRGKKVVLGGIHASMLPEEAVQHADSIVIGEAESIWQTLINDFKGGNLKKYYQSDKRPVLDNLPIPKWEFLSLNNYASITLQTTRGCPFDCEFCSVKAFSGSTYRYKPVDKILQEITYLSSLTKKLFFFSDDNLIGNKKYACELLNKISSLKAVYTAQVSIDIAKDEELLSLLAASGCKKVIIGFESLSNSNLKNMNKAKFYDADKYADNITKIQLKGIEVLGSFIVGCDFDDESVFEKTVDFINKSNISSVVLNILTPFPGTRLYKRLEEEGRILHKDWTRYDTSHVCFQPKMMSPEALQNGYVWLRQQVFSYESIFKRLKGLWTLWNKNNLRLSDRISPMLSNLDCNDVAFSYPKAVHPKEFSQAQSKPFLASSASLV